MNSSDSMNDHQVIKFLQGLGLDQDESTLYLTLAQKGMLTPLELSRASGVDRAKVYRRLERLEDLGVVEVILDEHTKRFQAADVSLLKRLLEQKEEDMKSLRNQFSDIETFLTGSIGKNNPETKVLFYKGVDGIRRMLWHHLRAKGEIVGYTYRPFVEITGSQYLKKWLHEFAKKRLSFRGLFSDEYVKAQRVMRVKEDYQLSTERYVPSSVLNIDYQTDIYNDVVAYYNWYEGELFGIEIYNKKIARMQKQIFEILWKMGSPQEPKKSKKGTKP